VKVRIAKDSQYPVFSLSEFPAGIEISDVLYERYLENLRIFEEIQNEIATVYAIGDSAGVPHEG